MLKEKGIKFKILLNSTFSIFIFSIFLLWISDRYWNVLLNDKKEKLKNIVEIGSSLVKNYIEKEKKGELSKEEAQKRAKDDVTAIRYSGKEYIFITNSKAYQVLNPSKPELSGKDMSNFKDAAGLKLYVEIANVAKKSGEGFVAYMFTPAGSTVQSKKLSYVYFFPYWDWIVGTGLYMDDAYAAMKEFLQVLTFVCIFCIVTLIFLGIYFATSIEKPLNDICKALLLGAQGLLDKSNILKDSSSSVKQYSQEQETSIQLTSEAISEITSMFGRTTELTETSAKLANNISNKAEDGEVSMKNMISSMQGIYEASSRLKEIERIINEIETKTQVITKIVSQTELLSLNASIEAARAAEHGKGFSVVAEEVGNLAHSSGKSSNEIKKLLQKSREEVQRILIETLEKVEDGRKRTTKVSESFSDIAKGIKEINHQMGQISDATKEQEIGVKQISNAIDHLDQLALKNTGESEKSFLATEFINTESTNLKEIVEKTENVVFGITKKKQKKIAK